jgi:sugar phosphate isomerase/epimerase
MGRLAPKFAMTISFSLAHLTVIGLSPPEVVRVAARAGYRTVGLRLIRVTETSPGYALMRDPKMMCATKSAMAETGVGVLDIELVRITPVIDVAGLEPFLAAGAELNARYVITAPYDPNLTRLADRLAAIDDLAVRYGLQAVLEFFPWTVVPNLDAAINVVKPAGRPGLGILVDTLHFDRSGSSVEQLARTPRSRLPFAHVADARAEELHNGRTASRWPRGAAAPRRGRDRYPKSPRTYARWDSGRARSSYDCDGGGGRF